MRVGFCLLIYFLIETAGYMGSKFFKCQKPSQNKISRMLCLFSHNLSIEILSRRPPSF